MLTQTAQPTPFVPTEALAKKILETVDAGLSMGRGNPVPGQMCVEAAVCYAMGLPHGDSPACVGWAVREFKIVLNDRRHWVSSSSRAEGLRALAIAQLGSNEIDQVEFCKRVAVKTVQTLLPEVLELTAKDMEGSTKSSLLSAAQECRQNPSEKSALAASNAAFAAYSVYGAIAANSTECAAHDAASATRASAYNAGDACLCAGDAVNATNAALALQTLAASGAARVDIDAEDPDHPISESIIYSVLCASNAADGAAESAENGAQSPEYFLRLSANIALEVLKEMNSPGCQFLYLLDQPVQPAQQ